jgi:hypothetical protein
MTDCPLCSMWRPNCAICGDESMATALGGLHDAPSGLCVKHYHGWIKTIDITFPGEGGEEEWTLRAYIAAVKARDRTEAS